MAASSASLSHFKTTPGMPQVASEGNPTPYPTAYSQLAMQNSIQVVILAGPEVNPNSAANVRRALISYGVKPLMLLDSFVGMLSYNFLC